MISKNGYSQENNEIELDVGLFHYYFDNSPIINTKYTEKASLRHIFLSSIGIQYLRRVKGGHFLNFGASYLNSPYVKYYKSENKEQLPAIGQRDWIFASLGYAYELRINETYKFKFGSGLFYRHGGEEIVVAIIPFGNPPFGNEVLSESVLSRDLGLNLNFKAQIRIWKFLYFHSSIDFYSILYFSDKDSIEKLRNIYDITKYPTRFDLSWHFGLGFAF